MKLHETNLFESQPTMQQEEYAAELTGAVYPDLLETNGSWLDLELKLWRALLETVKNRHVSPPLG